MDKAIPKDVFQANRDRAAPLLAKLKSEGISHMIGGKTVPSVSGETFETRSPVDGAVLATVARGHADDIDRAAKAAAAAFKPWRDMPAAARKKLLHRVADAIEDRRRHRGWNVDTGQAHRFMAKAAIRGGPPLLCRQMRRGGDGLNRSTGTSTGADLPGRR
jgi:5-carboxymethyl-2-hydroxymuconic-semialdehyde dehydrogenase